MARISLRFFFPHKAAGFTLPELMVSVLIVGLIAAAVSIDLRASQYTDELRTAVRVLAADIRSVQSQALTGQNVGVCLDANDLVVGCESGTALCAPQSPCLPSPPLSRGLSLDVGSSTYILFADVDPSKSGGTLTDPSEIVATREFRLLGSPRVTIHALRIPSTVISAHIAFLRQNGIMGINGCFAPTCFSPSTLIIELQHTKTGAIGTVEIDALSGRVSTP